MLQNKIPGNDGNMIVFDHIFETPNPKLSILYCGGFRSDRQGTKAILLEKFARAQSWEFLRFDYRGHGDSGGEFTDYGLADWVSDAQAMLDKIAGENLVVIGSSMGGWVALQLAMRNPKRVKGVVTIAAAPDFTHEHFLPLIEAQFLDQYERGEPMAFPSGYEEPYWISRNLIERSASMRIFPSDCEIFAPMIMLQGTNDQAVSQDTALRLLNHIYAPQLHLELVKNADHSFSRAEDIALIAQKLLYFEKVFMNL